MDKVVYKYKDEFQIDTYKDDRYILSTRVSEDNGDVVYQLVEISEKSLLNLGYSVLLHIIKKWGG